MSKFLYQISRFLSVFLVLMYIFSGSYSFKRCSMLIISLILFLIVSYMYEKKNIYFNITYCIYFVVLFLAFNISPFGYIHNQIMLSTIDRVPSAYIPKDHYFLYFKVFSVISLICIFYLLIKNTKFKCIDISIQKKEMFNVLIVFIFFLLPLFLFGGDLFRKILVSYCCFFIICLMSRNVNKKNFIYIFGIISTIFIILSQLEWRFVLVQYIIPPLFFYCYIMTSKSNRLSIKKKIVSISIAMLFVMLAILTEMNKLNIELNFENIMNIFTNYEVFFNWFNRQIYRIIGIWTVLGGNLIDYVDINGFYWGLSYIKFLSYPLSFEYIDLPKISAGFVGANYAQPGLIGDGYSNFGFFGAIGNILVVLSFAEYLWIRFINKPTVLRLLLSTVPFVSILVDGGTFNSIIFNSIFLIITLSLSLIGVKNK